MISLELAQRLRTARVPWTPTPGDRFVVPGREMDTEVFVISDMVVEVKDVPSGRILAFNGTTEWALDSVDADAVVWMPREPQLRELLGAAFVSLEALDGVGDSSDRASGWAVTIDHAGILERHIDVDAECAYARALLSLHP